MEKITSSGEYRLIQDVCMLELYDFYRQMCSARGMRTVTLGSVRVFNGQFHAFDSKGMAIGTKDSPLHAAALLLEVHRLPGFWAGNPNRPRVNGFLALSQGSGLFKIALETKIKGTDTLIGTVEGTTATDLAGNVAKYPDFNTAVRSLASPLAITFLQSESASSLIARGADYRKEARSIREALEEQLPKGYWFGDPDRPEPRSTRIDPTIL